MCSPTEGNHPAGEWRDPAIFGRIEVELSRDGVAPGRKHGSPKSKRLPQRVMTALQRDINVFAAQIRSQYPALVKKRALPTKQLIQLLIGRKLPPYPRRSGCPQKPEVTKATERWKK